MNGEKFLDQLYKDLHVSEIVMHSAGEEKDKLKKISKYMERLEKTHNVGNNEHKKNILKEFYYRKYVIEEKNIPYGVNAEQIINAQKISLSRWLDYLLDSNARYPMWAKYWAFQGMLKIGTYDETSDSYMKRSKKTLAPFIEVNPEILSKSIGIIQKYVNKEPLEEDVKKLIEFGSFSKIYTKLIKLNKKQVNIKENANDGIWIKYDYQTEIEAEMDDYPEYERLYDSLQGYNTGWCTAGDIEMAKDQICGIYNYSGGDFYVYYTKDGDGEYKVPRIAIRLKNSYQYIDEEDVIDENEGYNNQNYGSIIGEIRGVDDSQNLEEGLESIVEEKLRELSLSEDELEIAMRKVNCAKQLTALNRKHKKNIPLNMQDLSFLYELEHKIITFGWQIDQRINKLKESRNIVEDLKLLDKIDQYMFVIRFNSSDIKEKEIYKRFKDKILTWAYDRENVLKIFIEKQDYLTFDEKINLAKKNGLVLQYYKYESIDPTKLEEDELDAYLKYGLSPNDLYFVETCLEENIFVIKYVKNTNICESIRNTINNNEIFLVNSNDKSVIVIPNDDYAKAKIEGEYGYRRYDIKKAIKDKTSILEKAKHNIGILKYVDKSYFEDEIFLLDLLKISEVTMHFLPSEIKKNKDFILKAIKTNYKVCIYLLNQFSDDLELLKQCIDINVNVIRGVPDYMQDEEIALIAINKTFFSYLCLNEDLKNNDKIINIVCENIRKNKNYVMKHRDMMLKLLLEIISKNENYLKLFDPKIINELHIPIKKMIDANPRIILVVPSFRNNQKFLLYALSKDSTLLFNEKIRNMANLSVLLDGTNYIELLTEKKLASTKK